MTCAACNGTGTTETPIDGRIYSEPCNCELGESHDYSDRPDPDAETESLTIEEFGEIIRENFPILIDNAFDGELQQTSDEALLTFNGYGFRIHLNDGTAVNIQISRA